MKQSILKKSSHAFRDTESISSLNTTSNCTISKSAEPDSQPKNVRFVGLDLVQQQSENNSLESGDSNSDYISFQRLSNSSTSSNASGFRNYHRKSKTLALKNINIFPKPDDEELTVYSQQSLAKIGQANNSSSNISFQIKNQQQHQHHQQIQYELLKKTLRISSASIENKKINNSSIKLEGLYYVR